MSLSLQALLYRRFNCQCVYCQKTISRDVATIEHLKPKCYGGTDHKHNIVLACHACNNLRGNMELKRFFNERAAGDVSGALKLTENAMGWGADLKRLLSDTPTG
jgi:5-methylcytosine-specific restriction endonuclease McrA